MKKQLTVLLVGLGLQAGVAGTAMADAYDNFPLVDSAADALRPVMATMKANSGKPAGKVCYLYNPPTYDRLWTVPCDPSAPVGEPMKMCRTTNTTGWDAALIMEPCANQEKRRQQTAGSSPTTR